MYYTPFIAWEINLKNLVYQIKNKIDARKKMRSTKLTEGRDTGEK